MGREQNQSAESVWRDRLARFRKSKLTVAEFCRLEGVSDPSFYQWRKRLEQGPPGRKQVRPCVAPKTDKPQPFVPVHVATSATVEVEFPNGVRIRVPATHAEALRTAILAGSEVFQEAR